LKRQSSARVISISETWCKDCKRDIPKLGKIANILSDWEFLVLNASDEGVRENFQVKRIPTIIIYDSGGKELGRIVETQKYSCLEEDILKIVEGTY
jgi:thiol-disulfide isomerase/thioredoxin